MNSQFPARGPVSLSSALVSRRPWPKSCRASHHPLGTLPLCTCCSSLCWKAFLQCSPVSSYASLMTQVTPTSLSSSLTPTGSQLVLFCDPKALSFHLCVGIYIALWEFLFVGIVSSLRSGKFASQRPAGTGARRRRMGCF